MANKKRLRLLRDKTVINVTSKKQESGLMLALRETESALRSRFSANLTWEPEWKLVDIVDHLEKLFPEVDFCRPMERSSMRPDGGILSIVDLDGNKHPILISERKNQGTNDLRKLEGKSKQAKGNAVERLGKNVIGLKAAMTGAGIFPFVCFGDGCDFENASSILDRVVTIAMFGHLRKVYLLPQGPSEQFLRGSFFFREERWTHEEMSKTMLDIATRSIQYYFAKYGETFFAKEVVERS